MSASREEITKAILFDGLLAECQDRSAECRRQRAQIAELVAALEGIRNLTTHPKATKAELREYITEAARAALARANGAE